MLLQYWLSETVLESLARGLEEFEDCISRGIDARLAHIGASAELDRIGSEIVYIVKAMDGHIQVHFAHNSEFLAAWRSASHVVAHRRVEDAAA